MDRQRFVKRAFDLAVAAAALAVGLVPMLLVATAIRLTSKGPALYWSDRVGRGNRLFRMPKFRTLRLGAPEVATHLLDDRQRWVTPLGSLLRRTSLDELPQLWSILKGDMSFVGPRPALYNQDDLVAQRTAHGVHRLTPGLTGWAQIHGRDELTIPEKVALDAWYAEHQSLWLDLRILLATFAKVYIRDETASVGQQLRKAPPAKRAA